MSSIWGNNIKISVFGESHGIAVGVVIDGFPAGYKLDNKYINIMMDKRKPGKNKLSSARKESDEYEIISGIYNGYTTGSPITCIIKNNNVVSKDYDEIKNIPRPSHSDYPASVKYLNYNDFRGGGHFSGRLTAPIVFAGSICKSYLEEKYNIYIGSHIKKIHNIIDDKLDFCNISKETYETLKNKEFPTLSDEKSIDMQQKIIKVRNDKNSIGGIIEVFVLNSPVGIGEPMFDSLESTVAHIIFSIPSVKGVEFGAGFDFANMKGADSNDMYMLYEDKVITTTNYNGGVLGGLTTGMPVVFSVCIKPTPSIGLEQNTVNLSAMKDTKINITGRHDPCIVQRAVPVVECATAIAIIDLINQNKKV